MLKWQRVRTKRMKMRALSGRRGRRFRICFVRVMNVF